MKKFFRFTVILSMLVSLLVASATLVMHQSTAKAAVGISVTISGLEKGDPARLIIAQEDALSTDSPIFEKSVESDGSVWVVEQVSADLKDGNYQLVLDTTDKYFREPKGYLFQVKNSEIVNPGNIPITFSLIPPSARDYEPYRGPAMVANPAAQVPPPTVPKLGEVVYRAEYLNAISGEFRTGATEAPDSSGYHYFMVGTAASNGGVWGALGVVDPGVRRDTNPTEHALSHVYTRGLVSGQYRSIEIGWGEFSYQGDTRYLFEWDTNKGDNYARIYFSLTDGTTIDVATLLYSGTSWVALYWNGSYWVQMGSQQDLGFSTPEATFNGGELYSSDGTHYSFPRSYTTTNKLHIGSDWPNWDTTYYTTPYNADPYFIDITASYYNFSIYK